MDATTARKKVALNALAALLAPVLFVSALAWRENAAAAAGVDTTDWGFAILFGVPLVALAVISLLVAAIAIGRGSTFTGWFAGSNIFAALYCGFMVAAGWGEDSYPSERLPLTLPLGVAIALLLGAALYLFWEKTPKPVTGTIPD